MAEPEGWAAPAPGAGVPDPPRDGVPVAALPLPVELSDLASALGFRGEVEAEADRAMCC